MAKRGSVVKRCQELLSIISRWLRKGISSNHGRIVLCGLAVGLAYFPVWLAYLLQRAFKGGVSWFLIAAMLGLAMTAIVGQHQHLKKLVASTEDRLLGHILILSGVLLFPFCRFALWSQALIWLIILVGIVCSSWGVGFFNRFKLPTIFMALSVYPRLGLISRTFWEFVTPLDFLENAMASISAASMRAVGWAASADGRFIVFPQGTVEVGWGCNGLDMAIVMAIAGLFMGLVYKQTKHQIIRLVIIAIVLAIIANIPRLMLVSIAYVYWGKQWFRFWHGFWGGQIFSSVLFTIYYYALMGFMKRQSVRPKLN